MSCDYPEPKTKYSTGDRIMQVIILLAIMIMAAVIIHAAASPVKAMENDPTGAAGIPWGSSVSELTNSNIEAKHMVDSPAGISYYITRGMPKLGAKIVTAMFVNAQLVSVMYIFTSERSFMSHIMMLMIMHGPPDVRELSAMEWRGRKTVIQSFDGNGVMYADASVVTDLIERLAEDVESAREQKRDMEDIQPSRDMLSI